MKQVFSVKDLEEMMRNGKNVHALPTDALLTPSARDFLRDLENSNRKPSAAEPGKSAATSKLVTSKSSKSELEAYFRSAEMEALKAQICDVGRRLWQRAYVDGNG